MRVLLSAWVLHGTGTKTSADWSSYVVTHGPTDVSVAAGCSASNLGACVVRYPRLPSTAWGDPAPHAYRLAACPSGPALACLVDPGPHAYRLAPLPTRAGVCAAGATLCVTA